jgi:hypothetical protein
MNPEAPMQHAGNDIAEMGTAPSHTSCDRLYTAIRGFSRALLDCGVISAVQFAEREEEAQAAFASWKEPNGPMVDWIG